jgi:hypothetical protein
VRRSAIERDYNRGVTPPTRRHPAAFELPSAAPPLRRSLLVTVLISGTLAIALGLWARVRLEERRSLAHRLERAPPSLASGGRVWGPATVLGDGDAPLVCSIEAWQSSGGKRRLLWTRDVTFRGTVVLRGGRRLELPADTPVRVLGAGDATAVNAALDARLREVVSGLPIGATLQAACMQSGEHVFVDGCAGGDAARIVACAGGEPFLFARAADEPAQVLASAARYVPLLVAGASSAWLLALVALHLGLNRVGKTSWVLARRAAANVARYERRDRAATTVILGAFCAAAAALVLAGVAAGFEAAWIPAQAAIAWLAAASLTSAASGVLIRHHQARSASRLIHRLQTSTLASVGAGSGNVELALRVPADAPRIELPFVAGRHAAVQLRVLFDSEDHSRTWPERLPVEDASGSGSLSLDSFELGAWRRVSGEKTLIDDAESPQVLSMLEEALGTKLRKGLESASLHWAVWAVEPGDSVYVVGDAPDVKKGLGVYRGDGELGPSIAGRKAAPAVVFVGDETDLRRRLGFDARLHGLLAAILFASAAGVGAAGAVLAGLL